jgi:hypothetical protein
MNTPNDLERARLMELAVERTIGGLSETELLDLERSVGAAFGSAPRGEVDDSFERATAAVHLALQPRLEPMPRELAVRIADDADRHYAAQRATGAVAGRATRKPREPLPRWFAWGGWVAAAASFVAVIGVLALDKSARQGVIAGPQVAAVEPDAVDGSVDEPPAAAPAQRSVGPRAVLAGGSARGGEAAAASSVGATGGASDPAEARAALLASQPFALRRNWSAAGDPSGRGVTGDVVWDARTQTGYMRFVGLRRNDVAREQYQLWIFDGRRDERFPVDGGVFDSSGDGELVVPIRATLPVGTPLAFAVTVERAGGVVVSSRERVVVIARVS